MRPEGSQPRESTEPGAVPSLAQDGLGGAPAPAGPSVPYLTDHGQKRWRRTDRTALPVHGLRRFSLAICTPIMWRTASSLSNRRSITLSIRGQRSLCVDPARLESVPTTILSDLDRPTRRVGSSGARCARTAEDQVLVSVDERHQLGPRNE